MPQTPRLRASATTLSAIQAILETIPNIDSALILRSSHTPPRGIPGPCTLGVARRVWINPNPHKNQLGPVEMTFELCDGWNLGVNAIANIDDPRLPSPHRPPPRRWSLRTLEGIHTLLDQSEGFCSFKLYPASARPKGNPQTCDRGFVGTEWVDQSCGYSGDDFSGTVSWKLGSFLLEGTFFC